VPTLDLDRIASRLFGDERVLERIRRDYGLGPLRSPEDLIAGIVGAFGQMPSSGGQDERAPSDRVVFRAAVRALASNSRTWTSFLRGEDRLTALLHGYDPRAVAAACDAGALDVADLRRCLPGQTGSADARAIVAWARLLAGGPDLRSALWGLRRELAREGVKNEELTPVVAVFLGAPSGEMERRRTPPRGWPGWKVPGMGPVLASELLRNLRWSGLKPDRHIKRLLDRWFPDVVAAVIGRAQDLADAIGGRTKGVVEFLTYSLAGSAVTPTGRSITEMDNLLWALGAYLERRGKESELTYRLD
jgi:hypothetical protein